jgi:hypothetical protein
MLCRTALVRTDISEERIASIIRVTGIGEAGTLFLVSTFRLLVAANVVLVSSILVTLLIEAIRSSETSVLIRAIKRNITEYGIFRSQIIFAISSVGLTGSRPYS